MTDETSARSSHGTAANGAPALSSVSTSSFTELLAELGISLVVSTYQAGYVMVLRSDGATLNTHFRRYERPMGIAAGGGRLALGTAREVVEFRNMAAAADRVEPAGRHDACYLPRRTHVTGDIDIHEMAFGDEGLWFVNTRLSCLCTLDEEHSFVPRWRPDFVSGLSPQDRCHLNGFAIADGRPAWATALGTTDTPEGWRANKAGGGVLIDVATGAIVSQGLSMPHSPRWYGERLWLLESGDGSIGTVDRATGRYEAVGRVDGFTRGLSFHGPFAFVGISQVRESAMFSGLPLTERVKRRVCGVSVIDLRSGHEVAWMRFEGAVEEIFAVEVVPHRFPEIVEVDDELLNHTWALPEAALADVRWATEEDHGSDSPQAVTEAASHETRAHEITNRSALDRDPAFGGNRPGQTVHTQNLKA